MDPFNAPSNPALAGVQSPAPAPMGSDFLSSMPPAILAMLRQKLATLPPDQHAAFLQHTLQTVPGLRERLLAAQSPMNANVQPVTPIPNDGMGAPMGQPSGGKPWQGPGAPPPAQPGGMVPPPGDSITPIGPAPMPSMATLPLAAPNGMVTDANGLVRSGGKPAQAPGMGGAGPMAGPGGPDPATLNRGMQNRVSDGKPLPPGQTKKRRPMPGSEKRGGGRFQPSMNAAPLPAGPPMTPISAYRADRMGVGMRQQ